MSKMGAFYIAEMERKFGDVIVPSDTVCTVCGCKKIVHDGVECPSYGEELTCYLCDKYSESGGNHKECEDIEAAWAAQ